MATMMLCATPTSPFAARNGVCHPARPSRSGLHFIRIQRIACNVEWRTGRRDWVTAAGGSSSLDDEVSSNIGHVEENASKSTAPDWKSWQVCFARSAHEYLEKRLGANNFC